MKIDDSFAKWSKFDEFIMSYLMQSKVSVLKITI